MTFVTDAIHQAQGVLDSLIEGQKIPFGGNRWSAVSAKLSQEFRSGDSLVVVQDSGDLLHIPAAVADIANSAVAHAQQAFAHLATIDANQITKFFDSFATNLQNDKIFLQIKSANDIDVDSATKRGRSVTRLHINDKMRLDMVAALHMWRDLPDTSSAGVETVTHDSWSVEAHKAPLGVVGFVLLIIMVFINLKNAFKSKDFVHIAFAILMISLFLTESFLWRQRGVLFFMIFYCLFNTMNQPKLEKN